MALIKIVHIFKQKVQLNKWDLLEINFNTELLQLILNFHIG